MSFDIHERHDGLDDALRERLNRLGRSATAGSVPWPGVDRAIRRRRRTAALRTGAAALAVVALAGGTATALPRLLDGTTSPAAAAVTRSHVPPPPWRIPTTGLTPLYENVHVRLAAPDCDRVAAINLHRPATSASVPRDSGQPNGDLFVGRPCPSLPDVTTATLGVPVLIESLSDRTRLPGQVDCVRHLTAQPPDVGYAFAAPRAGSPYDSELPLCAILPADPRTGTPNAVVALHLRYVREGVVDVVLSAWTGSDEESVGLEQPENAPPPPQVRPPFRERYSDVPLHLPGRPQACTAKDETYLNLHVPDVNTSLGLSDAALSRPCPDPRAASLRLGDFRGVVLEETDVSAAECAAALEHGTKVATFTPVEGSTLCIISPADRGQHLPDVLVALTVTKVNPATGAFDLSATGWTGQAT